MKLLILLASLLVIGSTSEATETDGQFVIDGILTSKDNVNIPDGPGYGFKINTDYKFVSLTKIPENGTVIRHYSLKATLPAARPSEAYLGKSLLLLSNRLEQLCQEVGTKAERWKDVDTSSLRHSVSQISFDQYVEFNFSCFDR